MTDILAAIHRKPSVAVKAAIAGLRDAIQRDDFIVDMMTYGDHRNFGGRQLCMGCLATCTFQELAQVRFSPDIISSHTNRARAVQLTRDRYHDLEHAINSLRLGWTENLYRVCGLKMDEREPLPERLPFDEKHDIFGVKLSVFPLASHGRVTDYVIPPRIDYEGGMLKLQALAEELEARGF